MGWLTEMVKQADYLSNSNQILSKDTPWSAQKKNANNWGTLRYAIRDVPKLSVFPSRAVRNDIPNQFPKPKETLNMLQEGVKPLQNAAKAVGSGFSRMKNIATNVIPSTILGP